MRKNFKLLGGFMAALLIMATGFTGWAKTTSSSSSYRFVREGAGGIYMPSNFRYTGESEYDLCEKEFTDGTAYLYVTSDCNGAIPMSSFDYNLDFFGAISIVKYIDKSNYKVASGYTRDGDIYYCKMAKADGCVYFAYILYPPSKRSRYDDKMAKMFNSFPNVR